MRGMTTTASRRPAPDWLLDEVASAGRENLDAAHVARYDGKEDAEAGEEIALLRSWGLTNTSVVVDVGAGTGQFTLPVAPFCSRVIAVDISPVMLDLLRAKVADAGLTNVTVVQAGFLTYEHTGDLVDIVYSRYALHHLPDAWKAVALARLRRVLRPEGLLRLSDVVYNFPAQEAEERFEAWCATGGEGVVGQWSRAEIAEHPRDEHSTFTWLLEPMIERAGFHIEEALHSADGLFARYVLRAR